MCNQICIAHKQAQHSLQIWQWNLRIKRNLRCAKPSAKCIATENNRYFHIQESSQCLALRFSQCRGSVPDVCFNSSLFWMVMFVTDILAHHGVLGIAVGRKLAFLLTVWWWGTAFQPDEKTGHHQEVLGFELHAVTEGRRECDTHVGIRAYVSMSWPEAWVAAETASCPIKSILPLFLGTGLDFSQTPLKVGVVVWLNTS